MPSLAYIPRRKQSLPCTPAATPSRLASVDLLVKAALKRSSNENESYGISPSPDPTVTAVPQDHAVTEISKRSMKARSISSASKRRSDGIPFSPQSTELIQILPPMESFIIDFQEALRVKMDCNRGTTIEEYDLEEIIQLYS